VRSGIRCFSELPVLSFTPNDSSRLPTTHERRKKEVMRDLRTAEVWTTVLRGPKEGNAQPMPFSGGNSEGWCGMHFVASQSLLTSRSYQMTKLARQVWKRVLRGPM